MSTVITYGTFDLLHQGHINLLRRAKALGDTLIVGVTSDSYDKERGKLNVRQSLTERLDAVKATGFADKIIVEEYEGQKIHDIQTYHVDTFVLGDDWKGKCDYLKEYCDVVYLERTKDISSTLLRQGNQIITFGIVGTGRIAARFVKESYFVSGMEVVAAYNPHIESAKKFSTDYAIEYCTDDFDAFLTRCDAVYIASPHQHHFEQTMACLRAGKHVLCEKPLCFTTEEAEGAYRYAKEHSLALLHGVKTAYCPGFEHLVLLAKSGRIGEIVAVDASFTKLVNPDTRELRNDGFGGSTYELSPYPALAIAKLIGTSSDRMEFFPMFRDGVDIFDRIIVSRGAKSSSMKVGLGAKTEGDLVVTGTEGYLYAEAPWWKTSYFEMRFENQNKTRKYYFPYDGDGLRYEILEIVNMIKSETSESPKLNEQESVFMTRVIEGFTAYREKAFQACP